MHDLFWQAVFHVAPLFDCGVVIPDSYEVPLGAVFALNDYYFVLVGAGVVSSFIGENKGLLVGERL